MTLLLSVADQADAWFDQEPDAELRAKVLDLIGHLCGDDREAVYSIPAPGELGARFKYIKASPDWIVVVFRPYEDHGVLRVQKIYRSPPPVLAL